MNIPSATLKLLKCGECEAQLSRGPVYLHDDGAALCCHCFKPDLKATRNIHYETLAQLHVFPCTYSKLGCGEKVSFVQGGEVIPHEEMCEHRLWECPVYYSGLCDWLNPLTNLLKHCEDFHPELVLQNPCSLQHDIVRSNERTYLLRWFQDLFFLHVKVSVAAGKIYHSLRYLGPTDRSKNFWYNLYVKRKNESISKNCEVTSQEGTSLALNINSLLSVLGGFDGTTFTLEVQRQVEVCAGCGAQGSALVYRDKRGWICELCAPARRDCVNRALGCYHQDVDSKCRIHELYFCEKGTHCAVCYKAVKRGLFSAHLNSACKAVCGVGSTWRPVRGGYGEWCLVSSAAGTVVCEYILGHSWFDLRVYIPVTSERFREFRCVVRVTQPATGQVRTYTPDIPYDKQWDWHINVEKTEFPKWDYVFDVSVDITKILL